MKLKTAFRGATAALAQRKRGVIFFGLLCLALSLLAGVMARFSSRPVDSLESISLIAVWALVLVSPLVAAMGLTVQRDRSSATNRLAEISCLPLGPLALPASVFLLSGLVFAWSSLLTVLGLAVTAGGEVTTLGIGRLLAYKFALAHGALIAFAWLYFTALSCIGRQPAVFNAIWAWLPLCLTPFYGKMDYSDDAVWAYNALWLSCMSAYYLALPFVLYAQPRHHWFSSWKLRRTRFEMVAGLTAFLGLLFFGLFSWGRAVSFIALLGGGVLGLMRWGMPPKRRSDSSLIRVSYLLAIAAMLPPIALGLWEEHQATRDRTLGELESPQVYRTAPDGRSYVVVAREPGNPRRTFSFLVQEPKGSKDTINLPLRHGGSDLTWSRDGRYFAIARSEHGRLMSYASSGSFQVWGSGLANITQRLLSPPPSVLLIDLKSGERSEIDAVLLADGWSHPDDLIRIDTELDGAVRLHDRRGRELTVKRKELFEVLRYTADGPIVRRRGASKLWSASGFETLAPEHEESQRLFPYVSRDFNPKTGETKAYLELEDAETAEMKRLPLVSLNQRLVFRSRDSKKRSVSPPPYLLVFAAEGLMRFDPETDALDTILASEGRPMSFYNHYLARDERFIAIKVGDRIQWLDTRDWSVEAAELPAGFIPRARLADGALGISDRRWAWVDRSGALTILYDQPCMSPQEYAEMSSR